MRHIFILFVTFSFGQKKEIKKATKLFNAGDVQGAMAACDAQEGSVANVIKAGLLKSEQVKKDMNDPAIVKIIEQDLADAKTLNVQKTPGFFVNTPCDVPAWFVPSTRIPPISTVISGAVKPINWARSRSNSSGDTA